MLAGRKTQTRRLANSPLRRCVAGDRLYVREAWSHTGDGVFEISQARLLGRGGVIYRADDDPRYPHAKFWPSLHMPREFSRLTLIVEGAKVEPLHAITNEDCIAEGVPVHPNHDAPRNGPAIDDFARRWGMISYYGGEFRRIWSVLHAKPGERWDDNPQVVALTFRVIRGNIDQVSA